MYTDIAIHVQLLKHIMYITAFGVQYINILTNILLSCNIYILYRPSHKHLKRLLDTNSKKKALK